MGEPKKPTRWGLEDVPLSTPRPAVGQPIQRPVKTEEGDTALDREVAESSTNSAAAPEGEPAVTRLRDAFAQLAAAKARERPTSAGPTVPAAPPAPYPEPPPQAQPAPDPVTALAAATGDAATNDETEPITARSMESTTAEAMGRVPRARAPSAGHSGRDERIFASTSAAQVGIVGGKTAGKSYLFQAMVYRTTAGKQAGALNYYLRGIDLVSASRRDDPERTVFGSDFIQNYSSWQRLGQTKEIDQMWYRLSLHFRCGLLGQSQATLDIEFFDGSGEGFFEVPRNPANRQLWKEAYLEARTMIFCLPLWAAFPGEGFTDGDWQNRDVRLKGFDRVVRNYTELRQRNQQRRPVNTILALTQADDRRTALKTLQAKWIQPYMESPHTYLRQLRRGSGIGRYLANARTVSSALHEEFDSARDPQVASIPDRLDFGRGRPWLIPVSAIDGDRLEAMESKSMRGGRPPNPPVPVHVELPLLVALCDRHNALM